MRDTDFTLSSLLYLSQKCAKIAFGPWTGSGCQNKALAKTRSARHKDKKTTPSNGKENESPTRKRDHQQKLRIVWFRLEGLDMNKSTYRSFMPLEGVKRKWQGSSKKQAKRATHLTTSGSEGSSVQAMEGCCCHQFATKWKPSRPKVAVPWASSKDESEKPVRRIHGSCCRL